MRLKHKLNIDWLPRAALILIAVITLAMACLVALAVCEITQITPEDIGAVAGRVAKGFNDAKGQP